MKIIPVRQQAFFVTVEKESLGIWFYVMEQTAAMDGFITLVSISHLNQKVLGFALIVDNNNTLHMYHV